MSEILLQFLGSQRNRPLSVGVTVAALFVPPSLVIFLARPTLVYRLPLPTMLLLAVGISLPLVMLCFGLFYTPLNAIHQAQKESSPEGVGQLTLTQTLEEEDAFEWPCLLAGSWLATLIQFGIAAFAYHRPIRIGATYISVSFWLGIAWIGAFLLSVVITAVIQKRRSGENSAGQN